MAAHKIIIAIISCLIFGNLLAVELFRKSNTWIYDIISITTYSADETKLKMEAHKETFSRMEVGITGRVSFYVDIDETFMVECVIYYSPTGNMNFVKTPFTLGKQDIFTYLNGFYKQSIMEGIAECSNYPQFKDKISPPIPATEFVFNRCQGSNENMPSHMKEGYYKIVLLGSGPFDWSYEMIIKVEST